MASFWLPFPAEHPARDADARLIQGLLDPPQTQDGRYTSFGDAGWLRSRADEIDAVPVPRLEKDARGRAACFKFVGNNGRDVGRSGSESVEENRRALKQRLGYGDSPRQHRGKDDSLNLAIVHRLDQLPFELPVALRLTDEEQVLVLPSCLERSRTTSATRSRAWQPRKARAEEDGMAFTRADRGLALFVAVLLGAGGWWLYSTAGKVPREQHFADARNPKLGPVWVGATDSFQVTSPF